MNLRGTPDEATKEQITNEYALKYVDSLEKREKVPLETTSTLIIKCSTVIRA